MLEYIFIIVVLLAIILTLYVFISAQRRKLTKEDQRWFLDHWNSIIKEKKKNPMKAILDADKLLDKALSKKGYKGSVGEKLKKSKKWFSDLNGVWRAHKLRNQISHELNYKLEDKDIDDALNQFKKALKDLGVKL